MIKLSTELKAGGSGFGGLDRGERRCRRGPRALSGPAALGFGSFFRACGARIRIRTPALGIVDDAARGCIRIRSRGAPAAPLFPRRSPERTPSARPERAALPRDRVFGRAARPQSARPPLLELPQFLLAMQTSRERFWSFACPYMDSWRRAE